ncbi:MAG: c-type cytochrome [Burkholderiales bacterium]
MKTWISAALLSFGVLSALPAAAQFAKPEDAIKYRKSAMFLMSNHMGRIGAMASGRVPFDAKAAAENADVVMALSKLPFDAYGPGTDKGDTRAKPELWAEMDKFKATAAKLQGDAVKLSQAAKGGNLDALKAAFGETAQNCKACHDAYRKD